MSRDPMTNDPTSALYILHPAGVQAEAEIESMSAAHLYAYEHRYRLFYSIHTDYRP